MSNEGIPSHQPYQPLQTQQPGAGGAPPPAYSYQQSPYSQPAPAGYAQQPPAYQATYPPQQQTYVVAPQAAPTAPKQQYFSNAPPAPGQPPVVYVIYNASAVKSYRRQWKIGMIDTVAQETCNFLAGCCWGPCFSFHQREQILGHPLSPYTCCLMPQSSCCGCVLPRWCLACETCFCFTCSVIANRHYLQMSQGIMNSACDDAILCFACVLAVALRIVRLRGLANIIPRVIICSVIGCMQAQQQHELDHLYDGMAPPPQQQIMM